MESPRNYTPRKKLFHTNVMVIADEQLSLKLAEMLRKYGLRIVYSGETIPDDFDSIIEGAHSATLILSFDYSGFPPERIFRSNAIQWVNLQIGSPTKYAGALSVQRAIMSGETEFQIILHYFKSDLGCIDIIQSASTPILREDMGISLYGRAISIGLELYERNLRDILFDNAVIEKRLKYEDINWWKGEGDIRMINWDRTAFEIHNQIKAFGFPDEGAISGIKGEIAYLRESSISNPFSPDEKPGTIIGITKDAGLEVTTGNGILHILRYKIRGGYKPSPGDCFDEEYGIENLISEAVDNGKAYLEK